MKKGKRSAINLTTNNFSFNNHPVEEDIDPFEGFPHYHVWDETKSIEENSYLTYQSILKCLLHADKHHPKITGEEEFLYWPVIISLIFESHEQGYYFFEQYFPQLCHAAQLSGLEFAKLLNINLDTGIQTSPFQKVLNETEPAINFNLSKFSFNLPGKKQKAPISEKLQNIRSDEKKLADYMTWVADISYIYTICFKNEAHKNNFLKALGLKAEFGGKYIWCHDFAKALNLELQPCDYKNKPLYTGREKKLESFVLEE